MATSNLEKDEDDTKIRDTRGDAPSEGRYFQIMSSYIRREVFFVLTLVFTIVAAFQNSPLKTRKVNPPEFFFVPPSLVTDFYQGHLRSLLSLTSEKDVSLVMYYAPWDASCLQAREEIEMVARFYHNEVFFAAINCWWPEGECSKKFTISSYPLMLVHIHEVGAVRYEGPLISTYIISFLDFILTPLTSLHHTGELLDLLTKHEGVLIGYFEFKEGSYPNGYKEFYLASLKALSADSNRKICFAVVTNPKDAQKFKLKSHIQLYLWNSTEVFFDVPNHLEILKWAYSKLNQVTQWVTPPGVKSKILSENIEKRPALILFTPRNLLLEYSPYYSLFKEVAYDYSNCYDYNLVKSLIHRMVLKRHILQEEYTKMIEKCHRNDSEQHPDVCRRRPDLCDLTCCQSANFQFKADQGCFCRVCLHHIVENIQDMKLSECENTLNLVLKNFNLKELKNFTNCNDIEVSFPVKFGQYKQLTFHCETGSADSTKSQKKHLSEKEISQLKDDLILTMIKNNEKRMCHRLRHSLNYSELNFPSFPTSDDNSWLQNFTGMGCSTNKTLTFIAMDVVLYHSFAENLGIDVSKNYHQTALVIVEATQESQYVLYEHINKKVLVEFIKNYTRGSLDRTLRMPVHKLENCQRDGEICVEEVTTSTFADIVMDNKKDVVLFYYASWCGPCYSISHIFLSVADYFSNIDEIKFARISGEDNDLPWEYSVEKYPTIIFFPAKKKSDSVEFPPHYEVTVASLLHFVLVHTQAKVRRTVAMQMCNRDCVAHNLIMSSKELRRLFREHCILLNNLHFAQQIIYKPRKAKSSLSKQRAGKEPSMNYLKTVYLKDVIERIHKKRLQIKQALQLQVILRKKRNIFLKQDKERIMEKLKSKKSSSDVSDKTTKKGKHFDLRQKTPKDEL